jgi:hypothetical protein
MLVTTTGYFLAVHGPYLADAKNNDASILTHIIKNNIDDIKHWVQLGMGHELLESILWLLLLP